MQEMEVLKEKSGLGLLTVLKSVVISLVVTAAALFALALIYAISDIPEGIEKTMVTAISLFAVFFASLFTSKKLRRQGLLNGMMVGFLYMLILYLTGFLAFGFPGISKGIVATLLMGMLAGAVGGIIGVNVRIKRKKL